MDWRLERIDRRFDTMERWIDRLVVVNIVGFLTVIGTLAVGFWSVIQTVQLN